MIIESNIPVPEAKPAPKYTINESAAVAQTMAALRVLTVVSAGITTIMGFLDAHDMAAVWVWLQHEDGVKFVTAIIAVVAFGYSQYKTWYNHQRTLAAAKEASDETIKVVGAKS